MAWYHVSCVDACTVLQAVSGRSEAVGDASSCTKTIVHGQVYDLTGFHAIIKISITVLGLQGPLLERQAFLGMPCSGGTYAETLSLHPQLQ